MPSMRYLKWSGCLLCAVLVSPHVPPGQAQSSTISSLRPDYRSLELAVGDIVFRRGRSLNSRAVMLVDQDSRFSHVGIVVEVPQGLRVVHSVPPSDGVAGGVRSDPIEVFLGDRFAMDSAIYQLKRDNREQYGAAAAKVALAMAESRVQFDSAFDLFNAAELYCTELVWRAYKEAGIDLVEGRFDKLHLPMFQADNVILPSRLLKSPHLQPVFFPYGNGESPQ